MIAQPAITYSNSTIETLEQDVKMFKVNNKDTGTVPGVVLMSLLLTFNLFHALF